MDLPASLVNERPGKSKTLIAAFEKELGYLNSYIRKNKHDNHFIQKSSNTIFNLWTEYGSKLPLSYLSKQQLALGDVLYDRGLYSLACTHCYSRYLNTHLQDNSVVNTVAALTHIEDIIALLRSVVGDAMCRYHTVLVGDSKMMHVSSRVIVREVLDCLQSVSEAALSREQLYWLVYNTLSLSYTICRSLMTHPSLVLDYFLWGAVAMESSVPLMASKYLTMRTNFYTAVCYCYYRLEESSQAELFARRSLDKVHELAQLEGGNTVQEMAYRESSLKLGVVIFKRSVFLSRKKVRTGYRPKIRPSLREMLQSPTPRSPTEKLAWDMFESPTAVFMALLELLSDPSRRPFSKAPPTHPNDTELDPDTITDIFQELFCLGLDLALSSVESFSESGSLSTRAVSGGSVIPVEALVRFVRVAYCADQRDVIELLAQRLIQDTQVSVRPAVRSLGKGLELLLKMDSLASLYKQYKSSLPAIGVATMPQLPSLSELREDSTTAAAEEVFAQLQDSLSLLHLSVGDELLLATDFDLLLDAGVLIWELVRPAFSLVRSHDADSCQQFLSQPTGTQYVVFLAQLVDVFHSLELWRVDPVLQGELCLKLATLYEARATLRASQTSLDGFVLQYDRALLLECQTQLKRDVCCVEAAREEGATKLDTLHSQFLMAQTRVSVKLASTIPPPRSSQDSLKPSSLRCKVAEREEASLHRIQILSTLTAPTATVADTTTLRTQCRANHYKRALLSMSQASLIPQLDQQTKTALLEEAVDCLGKTTPASVLTTPPNALPPPRLINTTNTSMTFEPVPFADDSLRRRVCYYRVYGRTAAGSNVRVRLSDHSLSGTGVEVCAGERVAVRGLKTDVEYVFAVAGYSAQGDLVGGSIGATGRAHLASFNYPLLSAWGELCKAGFVCGVDSVAERAADRLWTEYTPLTDDLLSSQHSTTLHLLVQSVLIRTQLCIVQNGLFPDCLLQATRTLRDSQHDRLELAQRLVIVLTVCGVLNDRSLALQTAVTVYGLLAPLLHFNIHSKPLLDLCLHCYAVLGEVFDATHKEALHHMIAALGYYLAKAAIESGDKALFSLVADNARSLLIASMPCVGCKPTAPPPSEGLQQASLLSSSMQGSSDTATVLSGPPSLLPQPGNKRRRRNKKLAANADEICEESKSVEYRAFEGFLLSRAPPSEDIELTGQEDPILLHALIATHTSTTAHKELHKFRKRPQYLEYFVHLATATLNKGHAEKVFGWCREAFSWVSRRNELLLSPKQVPSKHNRLEVAKQKNISKRMSSRAMSAMGSSLNVATSKGLSSSLNLTTTRRPSKLMPKQLSTIGSSLNVSGAGSKQSKRAMGREMSSCGSSLNVGKRVLKIDQRAKGIPAKFSVLALPPAAAAKKGRLQSIQPTRILDVDFKITRDDVEYKAFTVLNSLLPTFWRTHRARKRLRSVCELELPWRAQANILSATCHLESLCRRLVASVGGSGCGPTLDLAGTLIEGVVPVYSNALAGTRIVVITPTPVLTELQVLMLHYRRAVTLAHRGAHWILVQNTVRSLLNAITCLRGCVWGDLTAALYGEAHPPLYCAVNALYDMLLNSGVGLGQQTLLVGNSEGECLVKRAVLLAVHVLYVHEHWEKVVSIIVKFKDITKDRWSEELSPLLSVAHTKLSQRLAAHKGHLKRTRIHPAAHLDPGPEGYDIYGGVGHSLGLSLVSTAVDGGEKNANLVTGRLQKARSLRCLYLTQRASLNEVLEAYQTGLDHCKEADLLAQAMSELGDLLLSTNTSSQWWTESLCLLLGVRDPLMQWRQRCCSPNSSLLTSVGLSGCLLAGQLAYKLARFSYGQVLDVRLEYTLLAASLFKTALSYSDSIPTTHLSFIHLHTETDVFPGVELFANEQLVSAPSLLAALSWTVTELLERQHPLIALPALWLYHHVAVSVCRDTGHTVHANILRLQSLTQLHYYQEALDTHSKLLTGSGLPQPCGTTPTDKHTDTHWVLGGFSNSIPLTDARNMKCVHAMLERSLSSMLTELYGPVHLQHLSLATAELYTALAEGLSPLHSSTALCRPGGQLLDTLKPLHSSSTTGAASSGSTLLVGSLSRPHTPSPATANKRHKTSSRQVLLDSAERLLVPLSEDSLATHSLLGLTRVARACYHRGAAVSLSLTAVRRQQSEEEVSDPRLWLETLCCLAYSLLGERERGEGLSCEEVAVCGGEQAETLGDYELAARLHYIAASHCLSQVPQQLSKISQHCQTALRLLETPRELSTAASLLRCHVTLLLIDVSCVSGVGGVTGVGAVEMVEVCRGLVGMLKQQLTVLNSDPDHLNIFLPHRGLLAATNLRLAHCLVHSANSGLLTADSAVAACEEGLLMLRQSSISDLCTQAELHALMGWLQSLSDESTGVSILTEAVGVIADAGIDSRLAVATLHKLSELTCNGVTIPKVPTPPPLDRRRDDSRALRSNKTKDSTNKPVTCNAWLFLKLASKTEQYMELLNQFISQVSNEEATKPLLPRVFSDLPDFVLAALCPVSSDTTSLWSSLELPPHSLLPSSQTPPTTGITLIKLASQLKELLMQCFWQKASLGLTTSNWSVHTHTLSQNTYPLIKALCAFLSSYSNHLKGLKPPVLPGAKTSPEQHLTASENELTVLWTSPYPAEAVPGAVVGYFALNAKSIRSGSVSSDTLLQGVGCHVIKTTLAALEEVEAMWTELGELMTGYLDNKTRPVSRSPSKQKKSERGVKVSQETMEASARAVDCLKTLLGVTTSKSPRLELSTVAKMAPLLRPFSQTTVKGELYHFFKTLFD